MGAFLAIAIPGLVNAVDRTAAQLLAHPLFQRSSATIQVLRLGADVGYVCHARENTRQHSAPSILIENNL
jgi:hypothetical protein